MKITYVDDDEDIVIYKKDVVEFVQIVLLVIVGLLFFQMVWL